MKKIEMKKSTIKGIAIAAAAVLALGAGAFAIHKSSEARMAGADASMYSTAKVSRGNIEVSVTGKGQLQASYGGGILVPGMWSPDTPDITYVVQEVMVKEGDAVSEGQVVATLSSPDLEKKINDTQNSLDALLSEISDMTGVAKNKVESLNPSEGIAVRAPISGKLMNFTVEEGQSLEAGVIVANIVDDSEIIVKITMMPIEIEDYKPGTKVKMQFNNFSGSYDGEVLTANTNPIPVPMGTVEEGKTPTGYVYGHVVTIKGKNPGLIQKGMGARVGIPQPNGTIDFSYYSGTVEKYGQEQKVFNPAESIVTSVNAYAYQQVESGDLLLSMAGEKLQQSIAEKLSQARILRNTLDQYKSQFGNLEVKSSITGIVSYWNAKVGDQVRVGQYLGDTYNTAEMLFLMQVDDIDIVNVQIGAPVEVTVDAMPGQIFHGEVMNISTRGDMGGGITKYDVQINMKGGLGLRPGMQANGHIDAGSGENVLLVPIEAVFEENGEQLAEVLEDGTAKTIKVRYGLMNSRMAEVLEGLEEGQEVIIGSKSDVLPSDELEGAGGFLPESN